MKNHKLQWHPGFQAAIQIELLEDQEYLQFEKEYNLTEKPLMVDTLIIKLEEGHQVKKSIGRAFKQYNIVEYKGPADYISINDFFRVMAYACTFQSNTEKILERPPKEITITFAANRYPRKLMWFLQKEYGAQVVKIEKGIYYIYGLMFAVQLVLLPKLPKEEYIWLSRLRSNLNADDVERLSAAYVGKSKNPLYAATMDLIIKANKERYKEARNMCEAILEVFADEYEQKRNELIEQMTQQGIVALVETCLELGMSKEQALTKAAEKFGASLSDVLRYVGDI